nr:MAG TPA: hypothetical protein [Caudoviricetes sp.]
MSCSITFIFIQFLWCVSPVFCKDNEILVAEQIF